MDYKIFKRQRNCVVILCLRRTKPDTNITNAQTKAYHRAKSAKQEVEQLHPKTAYQALVGLIRRYT